MWGTCSEELPNARGLRFAVTLDAAVDMGRGHPRLAGRRGVSVPVQRAAGRRSVQRFLMGDAGCHRRHGVPTVRVRAT